MRVSISISRKFAARVLFVACLVTLGFAALSLIFEVLNSVANFGGGQAQLFDLDADQNIPTWYTSSILFLCALFLAAVAVAAGNAQRLYWYGLSLAFLFLSADEASSIHEKARPVLNSWLQVGGFANYVWVLLYGPLALVFVLAYVGFLRRLPHDTRRLFFIAGALYIGGALGMEVVDGLYATFYSNSDLVYVLLTHIEELLEMLGVAIFIYSLLLHISSDVKELKVGSSTEAT